MSESGYPPPPPPPGPQDGDQHYGQMPSMPAPGGVPAGPVTRPQSMDLAVLLMKVGAALSVIGLALALVGRDAIRTAIEKGGRTAKPPLTTDQIDQLVTVAVVSAVISGLIGALLWLWMAWANGKGKKWARIVATVFFGLSLLAFLLSFLQDQTLPTRLLGVIQVVLGAYIIFLLYKKESTAYYQAASTPRM